MDMWLMVVIGLVVIALVVWWFFVRSPRA